MVTVLPQNGVMMLTPCALRERVGVPLHTLLRTKYVVRLRVCITPLISLLLYRLFLRDKKVNSVWKVNTTDM